MTFEAIMIPVLTFLLGVLVSALFGALKFSNRLAVLEITLNKLEDKVSGMKIDSPPCSFHIALDKSVVELKGRVDALVEERDSKR